MSGKSHRIETWLSATILLVAIGCLAQAPQAPTDSPGSPPSGSNPQAASNANARDLFEAAAARIRNGQYSSAVPLLRQAVALAPQVASLHHYLGYALWKLDQTHEAEREFQKAHQLDPTDAYTCYFLARIAQSSGDMDHSILFYEKVLQLGPAIYDTNQRLGQEYFDKGSFNKARIRIESALQQTPWDGSLYYQLGKVDQKTGRSAQAKAEFSAAERLKRKDQATIQRLVELSDAVSNNKADAAHQLRDEFLRQSSQDPEVLDAVGVLLGRGGFYDDALEPLERSVKLAPDSYESHYNLGLTLLRLNRYQEAERELRQALNIEPASFEANSALAVLDVSQDRNLDAIERLRVADQAWPGDAKILALLGQQYLEGHYVEDAARCFKEAIRLRPDDPKLRYLLIEAYEDQHDYDRALKLAQETAQQFPDAARADFEVGMQLANLARYEEARPYAERALQKDATLVEAYNLLADIDSRRGDYQSALNRYQKARELDAKNATALRGIGDSLIRLKRLPEALTELQQAVAVQPQSAGLYYSLMQVYTRLGEHAEAEEAAANYQKLHALEDAQRQAQNPRRFPSGGVTGPD